MAKFKELSFVNKFIYSLNIVFALLLILAYLLPFIPPKLSSTLSIINLGLGLFILCNLFFVLYWLISLKRQIFLSLICIGVGFNYWNSIYAFNSSAKLETADKPLKVMSYNVRLFNIFNWIDRDDIPEKIKTFISEESPDILALQDYLIDDKTHLNQYKYVYKQISKPKGNHGLAIYSQHKIINRKNLKFKNTSNNAIYADIVVKNDTLRVFSIHLESLKIRPEVKQFKSTNQEKILERISNSFIKQQSQAELIADEISKSPYKVVLCADLNNSPVSYVSKKILGDRLTDSFRESGQGFGKTFDFDFIPLRIDVIFIDQQLTSINFKNYDVNFSDHYPIMTYLEL